MPLYLSYFFFSRPPSQCPDEPRQARDCAACLLFIASICGPHHPSLSCAQTSGVVCAVSVRSPTLELPTGSPRMMRWRGNQERYGGESESKPVCTSPCVVIASCDSEMQRSDLESWPVTHHPVPGVQWLSPSASAALEDGNPARCSQHLHRLCETYACH